MLDMAAADNFAEDVNGRGAGGGLMGCSPLVQRRCGIPRWRVAPAGVARGTVTGRAWCRDAVCSTGAAPLLSEHVS